MKIVKKVGEQLPDWLTAEVRPVLAFGGAGTSLVSGSIVLAARAWAWLSDRLNLPERLGVCAAGVYAAAYGGWHAPEVAAFAIPGALVAWCTAAWWHTPPTPIEPGESAPASAPADGFVLWLLDLIGDRPGIHLRDLYPAMRTLPGHEDRDNTQLRAALRALDIPVRRSLRLGGVAGRSGVAVADLKPLPSSLGESGVDSGGDAGQSADSPAGESVVERLESA